MQEYYTDDTYDTYGNYSICKMEADYDSDGWNFFGFKASGRSHYWYHYINGEYNNKGTDGDWKYISL